MAEKTLDDVLALRQQYEQAMAAGDEQGAEQALMALEGEEPESMTPKANPWADPVSVVWLSAGASEDLALLIARFARMMEQSTGRPLDALDAVDIVGLIPDAALAKVSPRYQRLRMDLDENRVKSIMVQDAAPIAMQMFGLTEPPNEESGSPGDVSMQGPGGPRPDDAGGGGDTEMHGPATPGLDAVDPAGAPDIGGPEAAPVVAPDGPDVALAPDNPVISPDVAEALKAAISR